MPATAINPNQPTTQIINSIPTAAEALLNLLGAPHTPQMLAAAEAWIQLENGVNGNVLGVTHTVNGQQQLYTYTSAYAGLQAAVNLLNSSNRYSNVLAQAKVGNAQGFINALATSGWNTPYYSTNNRLSNTFHTILNTPNYVGPKLNSTGGSVGSGVDPVGAVTGAVGSAINGLLDTASAPIIFVGIILIGIAFVVVGGIVTLNKSGATKDIAKIGMMGA